MKRKGVSPLIAAVLLIAFTMAVAAILTAWVTTFTQEQTQQLGNESSQQIDCQFGQIDIFDASTNASAATATVTNQGRVDFENVSITALNGGSVVGTGWLDETLNQGETLSRTIDADSEADTVRVATVQCPTVSDEESGLS